MSRILFPNIYLFSPGTDCWTTLWHCVWRKEVNHFHPGNYLMCERCRIEPHPAWCLDEGTLWVNLEFWNQGSCLSSREGQAEGRDKNQSFFKGLLAQSFHSFLGPNGLWALCPPPGLAVDLLPSLAATVTAITDLWLSETTNRVTMSHILMCVCYCSYFHYNKSAINKTHHLPSEDFDPLICFHTRFGTEIENPLRKHHAEDTKQEQMRDNAFLDFICCKKNFYQFFSVNCFVKTLQYPSIHPSIHVSSHPWMDGRMDGYCIHPCVNPLDACLLH